MEAEKRLLEANGHAVVQFVCDSGALDTMKLSKKTATFLQIPYNLRKARMIEKFVSEHKPDLAHVHNVFPMLSPSVYGALARKAIPVVQTIHNYRFLCPNGLFYVNGKTCEACQENGYWEAIKNRCMHGSLATSALYAAAVSWGWRNGSISSRIDRYIALNAFVAGKLVVAGLPKEKICICGNFVSDFADTTTTKERYALYLGRLSSEKGLTTLLNAARSVPELPIRIAGAGPLEDDLRRVIDEPGMHHIQLVGHVAGEAKRRLIAEALCMVTPSECYENFPLSVAESLAQGTPVIASHIGGLPDLIEHDHTGLLFPAGDSKALAECLSWMNSNPLRANEMAVNALDAARTRFSPQRHMDQLLEIYQEALANRITPIH